MTRIYQQKKGFRTKIRELTIPEGLYPFLRLIQTEGRIWTSIEAILVNMKHLFA
jgi:hypothetical protein